MVAQGKGMAGTVVWGAKVWTGPSHPAKSRDRSPKNEVFSLWFLYTQPHGSKQSLPIQGYGWGKGS